MKKIVFIPIAMLVLMLAGFVYVRTAEAVSFQAFVNLLLEKGIIAQERAESVRKLAEVLDNEPQAPGKGPSSVPAQGVVRNADKVKVEVSQLIQHGTREYTEGDEIRRIIMNVENTTDEQIVVDGRRRCVVSYELYDSKKTLVYDSGAEEECQSGEGIFYYLGPKQVRIIEVRHPDDRYHLEPGVYTIKLNYPGYGEGQKEITVRPK